MKKSVCFCLCGLVFIFLPLFIHAAPAAGPTILISRNGNIAANDHSYTPDLSADGRYITFASDASTLVAGDGNGRRDIFVADAVTGEISRVSVSTFGQEADGDSFAPAISADGLIVVFYSLATNLGEDNPGVPDIFAHDRQTGETRLISKVLGGSANGGSYDPDISGDGRFVVFWSTASNLVGGDNNFQDDVFRYDRLAQTMERVSVDSNEQEGNGHSHHPTIANGGQRVVFVSAASNLVTGDGNGLNDIFLRDMGSGTTSRLNLSSGGVEANGDSWESSGQLWTPVIAGNGQFVAFVSFADNLVAGDSNGYPDVFVRDLAAGHTSRASLAGNGSQANDWTQAPAISEDGRFVSFQSFATNLVAGNVSGSRDIFVRDRQEGTLARASINSSGQVANMNSKRGVISGDGRYVVFASKATNLVEGDTNGRKDIFRHDLQDPIPPAALTINHPNGAPGSIFAFTGVHFAVSMPASLYVNGVFLGSVDPDSGGTLNFQLISLISDQEGWYVVRVVQEDLQATTAFELTVAAPIRSGSGGGFNLPPGTALTETLYFPTIFQQ